MYLFQGLFAVFRIILCFYLLFGVLAPIFLPISKKEKGIDLLMYSWVGLGGLIIVDVMILTVLNLYDFISLFVTLVLIPIMVYIIKKRRGGLTVLQVLLHIETRIISQHVRVIESTISLWKRVKTNTLKKPKINVKETTPPVIAFFIALSAAVIRIIPAMENSAPFSRNWYFELAHVKSLSVQTYFEALPIPKGLHALVHVFSTLTQVTPELILHILGALTSFFLALVIFWIINVITDSKNQVASLFGMAIYSLTPMFLSPIILDLEVEANAISLALCFAIPTSVFFLRQIRLDHYSLWFYIAMGMFATAFINLFVFIVVLIPTLLLGLFTLPIKTYFKRLIASLSLIILLSNLAMAPYIIACLSNGISIRDFLQQELFDTLVFSYFPNLVVFLDELSLYYLFGAALLIIVNIILLVNNKITKKKELVFLVLFSLVSFIYTPYFPFSYVLIDPDQLNIFYSVTIAVFIGLVYLNLSRLFAYIFSKSQNWFTTANISTAIIGIVSIIFLQGGVFNIRALPETMPNGFFDAYYNIVKERVPYTYATVSPELDRQLARNRHYFMNYEFFLDNYGVIDSLYQQYLLVPVAQREQKEIPPASIFLFLEKPPYSSIQQGILYNSQSVMNDMQQWISVFRDLPDRNIDIYYESEDAVVYEIINRRRESRISAVLSNVFPDEEEGVRDEED